MTEAGVRGQATRPLPHGWSQASGIGRCMESVMNLRRLHKFVMLAAAGGIVFQTTASCTTQFVDAFTTSFLESFSSALNSTISAYIGQLLGGTV
jgi:hypothetical protein